MKKIVIAIVAILIIFGIGLIVIPYLYLSNGRSFQKVSISGDGFQLRGYLSLGSDPEGEWIIFVHGNRKEGQNHELYQTIRESFSQEYSILALDLRGFGGSTGEGIQQYPRSIDRSEDLHTTVAYIKDNYDAEEDEIILVGHSLGAAQVLKDAQNHSYLMVIPIGLGNWDDLIDSPRNLQSYIRKFEANTGTPLDPEIVIQDIHQFSTQALFIDCPDSPVWFIYADRDDGLTIHDLFYQSLKERCQPNVKRSEVAISDHMYGTEEMRIPEPLRGIYSRYSLSFLKWRINQILATIDT